MLTGSTPKKVDSVKYTNIFSRMWNASSYSIQGLTYALRHEQAFQYEAAVFVFMCVVIAVFGLPMYLSGAWLIVMCFELVNSAVEKAFDLITQEYSPLVKAGKDMLSASIFLMICVNIILWCVAIISYLT